MRITHRICHSNVDSSSSTIDLNVPFRRGLAQTLCVERRFRSDHKARGDDNVGGVVGEVAAEMGIASKLAIGRGHGPSADRRPAHADRVRTARPGPATSSLTAISGIRRASIATPAWSTSSFRSRLYALYGERGSALASRRRRPTNGRGCRGGNSRTGRLRLVQSPGRSSYLRHAGGVSGGRRRPRCRSARAGRGRHRGCASDGCGSAASALAISAYRATPSRGRGRRGAARRRPSSRCWSGHSGS